jgi:hypothetical protein
MDKNFGIAFFFFDRLFGTLARAVPVFNQRGYDSALWRFGDLLRSPGAQVEGRHHHLLDEGPEPGQTSAVEAEFI